MTPKSKEDIDKLAVALTADFLQTLCEEHGPVTDEEDKQVLLQIHEQMMQGLIAGFKQMDAAGISEFTLYGEIKIPEYRHKSPISLRFDTHKAGGVQIQLYVKAPETDFTGYEILGTVRKKIPTSSPLH